MCVCMYVCVCVFVCVYIYKEYKFPSFFNKNILIF